MSKILAATCENSKVTCQGVEIPTAVILTEGKHASEGILIIEEGVAFYIASTVLDLKDALTKLISALDNVSTSLKLLDNHAFLISADNGVPSPPVCVAAIASLDSLVGQLSTLKGVLR
jgi:hypothetical protein